MPCHYAVIVMTILWFLWKCIHEFGVDNINKSINIFILYYRETNCFQFDLQIIVITFFMSYGLKFVFQSFWGDSWKYFFIVSWGLGEQKCLRTAAWVFPQLTVILLKVMYTRAPRTSLSRAFIERNFLISVVYYR